MKKMMLICAALLLSTTVIAAETEPEKISSTQLSKITFEGDHVILYYKDGETKTIDDMETIIIDMSDVSAIQTARQIEALKDKDVYNLSGQHVGRGLNGLAKGIYIVDGKKIVIK